VARWRFILAQVTDGVEVAEVFECAERRVSLPLNGLPTASFRIQLDNPVADTILGASALQRINLLLKCYRDGVLRFCGPLVSAEEAVSERDATLSVGAAGPLWRLFRRLVGKSTAGYGDGTPLALKDLGTIAKNMIDVANAEGDTGIRIGAINPSTSSYVGPWYFKKVAEAVVEIGPATLGGFDFELVPVEPVVDVGGLKIATFNTYATLGTDRGDAASFEFGVGRHNVASYRRPISGEGVANKLYHLAPGFPDAIGTSATPIIIAQDAASIAARLLHEEVVQADLATDPLRQTLLDEHVAIRKQPREQVIFTPVANVVPDYGEARWVVGDVVSGRARWAGRTRFDAAFRVYGADFAIDNQGVEQIDVTLVNES
jgi:hypothetical protein